MSHKRIRLSGAEALDEAFYRTDHTALREHLGVEIDDESLKLALTHRSFAHENGDIHHNERLEFLGDAVLGLSVATELYLRHPDKTESDISKMRASVVSRYGCAEVARDIDLGSYVLLGKGEMSSGGRGKDSILADTTEAIIGAVYLVHGFEPTRDMVLHLFKKKLNEASTDSFRQDWKTLLQESAATRGITQLEYVTTSEGPDHALTFTAKVKAGDKTLGTGVGKNKKLAEQAAAREACEAFGAVTSG